jgi:hypothetical protein
VIRKLIVLFAFAGTVVLGGCSSSEDFPLAPPVIEEAAPVATAQSVVTVGILGAQSSVGGAVLVVPPGALPIGTQVALSVWSSDGETFFEVDFGGAASFVPSVLTIHALGGGPTSLYANAGFGWSLVQTSLTGVFTRPLSAAASFKTSDDTDE